MDKTKSDKIITKYIKKIYGFSLSKTKNIDLAEELASRITFEAYKSLLNSDEVENIDGYIYRISQNVYNRFMSEEIAEKELSEKTIEPLVEQYNDKEDEYLKLRNAIAYLSKTQREVVVMHYYDKKKIKDIAKKLCISLENVKWHLFEARNKLKDGYSEQGNLYKSDYIKLINIANFGSPGPLHIEVPFFFTSTLSQNIVYSAYDKAKTATEIAKKLGVPAVFVENEVEHLIESNFMTMSVGNKLRSNIFIDKPNIEKAKKIDAIVTKYAYKIYEDYIPELLKAIKLYDRALIYTPNNDVNFFLWTMICYACYKKLAFKDKTTEIIKHIQKRRYYGENIALATLEEPNKHTSNKTEMYIDENFWGSPPDFYPYETWQFTSKLDDRSDRSIDWMYNQFENLYDFLAGRITKDIKHIYTYKNLFDKGFIISKRSSEVANIVITKLSEEEFSEILPPVSAHLKKLSEQIDEEQFNILKKDVPKNMHDICRAININRLAAGDIRVSLVELLLKNNILKPLKKNQRMSVNTIMFNGIMPTSVVPELASVL
ncbi:MAG: RNA polymerase sigma factor [Candidatus Cloacimonetes bacterium]|nr:RNA polymerase sigma factor [Candidatus Cloacimonadota bacterium]